MSTLEASNLRLLFLCGVFKNLQKYNGSITPGSTLKW
jgi:hypothetical protein